MIWGLDIGGTKCAFIEGDSEGNILRRTQVATADYQDWRGVLGALLPEAGAPEAIGVSCGGPLDSRTGVIMSPPNLRGWDDVHITEYLSDKYSCPAFVQNDANACALAEWKFGAGRGYQSLAFLTFGTGFGAGLILDGRLYAGASDMAGEIGHVRAAEDGPVGYNKRGSFEGFCSGGGIAQLSGGVSAREVVERAGAGDEGMLQVINKSAFMLGRAAALLMDVVNPEVIIIGSVFARSEAWFRPEMERVIEEEALPYARRACRVVPAQLGDKIGDVAALTVAINGLKEKR